MQSGGQADSDSRNDEKDAYPSSIRMVRTSSQVSRESDDGDSVLRPVLRSSTQPRMSLAINSLQREKASLESAFSLS